MRRAFHYSSSFDSDCLCKQELSGAAAGQDKCPHGSGNADARVPHDTGLTGMVPLTIPALYCMHGCQISLQLVKAIF